MTIFGIPYEAFESQAVVDAMSDYEKYQYAIANDDCEVYDDMNTFCCDLNNGCISPTERVWFFLDL